VSLAAAARSGRHRSRRTADLPARVLPAGRGWQLPARLGALRAEDGSGRRAADQRAVPSLGVSADRARPENVLSSLMQPSAGIWWSAGLEG